MARPLGLTRSVWVVRVGDGSAVAICSQDVVPCHVGRVLSCRAVSRVMSCQVAPCRVMSSQVMSRCDVMPCHVVSCLATLHHVISVVSCHVLARHVASCHVATCRVSHVMSLPVLSHLSCRDKRPQHIDAATSLSHRAIARRSHSHSSYSYHSRSRSLHSHHSHSCARVAPSTSHGFRFRLPTRVFYLSFRCGVIRSYCSTYVVHLIDLRS